MKHNPMHDIMQMFGYKQIGTMNEEYIHVFVGAGPRVGKTYCATRFAEKHGLKRGSTSDVVMARLCLELQRCHIKSECGFTGTRAILQQIKRNKKRFRWLLEAVGDKMCAEDPYSLAGKLIEDGCTVIDGIRRKNELSVVVNKHRPFVKLYWVERPGYPKVVDNTDISYGDIVGMASVVVINNVF